MVNGAVVVVPLEIYNDLTKMKGRVDAVCDYIRGSGCIDTSSLLRMLDKEYLVAVVEKKNKALWENAERSLRGEIVNSES